MSTTGKKKTTKNTNIWGLKNVLLNNQQIYENENTKPQNLWDSVKALLRGRYITIQAYLKKQEKNQINNITLHLKQLEKEEMKKARVSRRGKNHKN